jgi:choline dehydrogenase-like flavoprotein
MYGYVIIGGGTAGNAIAARLARDPNNHVAVIEAGGFYEIEDGNRSVVPGYAFQGQAPGMHPSPLTDWGFKTIPQQGLSSLMQEGRHLEHVQHSTTRRITGMLSNLLHLNIY